VDAGNLDAERNGCKGAAEALVSRLEHAAAVLDYGAVVPVDEVLAIRNAAEIVELDEGAGAPVGGGAVVWRDRSRQPS